MHPRAPCVVRQAIRNPVITPRPITLRHTTPQYLVTSSNTLLSDAGKRSDDGAATCESCTGGSYSVAGSRNCSTCAGGTYSNVGAASCITCNSGTYSEAASSACTKCDGGTWSNVSAAVCVECVAGRSSSSGASACALCDAGKHSGTRASSCSNCDSGTYQLQMGAAGCENCTKVRHSLSSVFSYPPPNFPSTTARRFALPRVYTNTTTNRRESTLAQPDPLRANIVSRGNMPRVKERHPALRARRRLAHLRGLASARSALATITGKEWFLATSFLILPTFIE